MKISISHNNSKHDVVEDNSALSRRYFMLGVFILGVLVMSIPFAINNGSAYTLLDSITNILTSIGASIIASVIFYLMYAMLAEERVLMNITSTATKSALDYSNSLFATKFDQMLPKKYYPETDEPTSEFDRDLHRYLLKSRSYKYKGESGNITCFRIAELCKGPYLQDKDISLLVIDPRECKLLEERACAELIKSRKSYSRVDLVSKASEIRKNIFISLIALFDICHMIKTEIVFHKELLFFRTEIFDDGLFITYYLGGEYPGTYLYPNNTFSYKAFSLNYRQNYNISDTKITFDNQMTENEFIATLSTLGCDLDINELRNEKNQLFKSYNELTIIDSFVD